MQLDKRALLFITTSYFMWGFFPIYFNELSPAGPFEVITYRAFFGMITCIVWLATKGRLAELASLTKQDIGVLVTSGLLIGANWSTFIYTVLKGNTIDSAIGYYINPLLTVVLGVLVLKEKMRKAHVVASILGLIAVIILVIAYGQFPWVSLLLASTFALYGLMKKRIAHKVKPVPGMLVETVALVPFVAIYYIPKIVDGTTSLHVLENTNPDAVIPHFLLLSGSGLLTMIPLILFAEGAGKLPLNIVGMLQYIAPTMTFILGVTYFHESMPFARWLGVSAIWLAVIIMIVDGLNTTRKKRKAKRAVFKP